MVFGFNSEKLQAAKIALSDSGKKVVVQSATYKVVSGGVTVYMGLKYNEAFDAFSETGRKDKQFWKLSQGTVKRIG